MNTTRFKLIAVPATEYGFEKVESILLKLAFWNEIVDVQMTERREQVSSDRAQPIYHPGVVVMVRYIEAERDDVLRDSSIRDVLPGELAGTLSSMCGGSGLFGLLAKFSEDDLTSMLSAEEFTEVKRRFDELGIELKKSYPPYIKDGEILRSAE